MSQRLTSIVVAVALLAGCAGPAANVGGSRASGSGAAPPAHDIVGTWTGSYWQLGMVYYLDDADCTLQIREDSTFTSKCTRSRIGTNNLAKSSSWSGRAVTDGAGAVVLRNADGPWPWITLHRSGNDVLYGTTLDPLVGATVAMKFERQPQTLGR